MQRKPKLLPIPDMINKSIKTDFVQIPNKLLHNPEMSMKAKGLLCMLLSNQTGWKSYTKMLQQRMSDGKQALQTGLKELIELGYLIKGRYRDKESKRIIGTVWTYTNEAYLFDSFDDIHESFEQNNYEWFPGDINVEKPEPGNPDQALPGQGNQHLIRIINKNKNKNNKKGTMLVSNERHKSYSEDSNYFDSMDSMENPSIKNNSNTGTGTKTKKHNKVIPSNFEEWYALYPRKKNKPAARKAFNKIATSTPIKNRPTLKKLIVMVKRHSQTEQWNRPDKKGIPYPATWLNKERWELSVQEVNEAFNLVKEIKADKANKNKIRGSHSKSADKLTISNTTVVA